MKSYVFMTDSDSDLPYQYLDQYDLKMVYMPYVVDGVEYLDDLGRNGKQAEYFENMRNGTVPMTSLLPTGAYLEYFEPVLAEGKDILFIAFSSTVGASLGEITTIPSPSPTRMSPGNTTTPPQLTGTLISPGPSL